MGIFRKRRKRTAGEVAETLASRARYGEFFNFECSWCGAVAAGDDVYDIAELIEHCLFDHAGRADVIGNTMPIVAVSAERLARTMGIGGRYGESVEGYGTDFDDVV